MRKTEPILHGEGISVKELAEELASSESFILRYLKSKPELKKLPYSFTEKNGKIKLNPAAVEVIALEAGLAIVSNKESVSRKSIVSRTGLTIEEIEALGKDTEHKVIETLDKRYIYMYTAEFIESVLKQSQDYKGTQK